LAHGARRLPGVEVVSYNVELKDENGFVGDRASKRAFRHFIEEWRKPLRRIGQDGSRWISCNADPHPPACGRRPPPFWGEVKSVMR
jgi:hypothetical protein